MAKDHAEDPALIGRTIAGKFAIESYVGGGAMGAVYKAKQIALDKIVAIKVMHREIATDEKFVTRFKREAKAASRLDHPNSLRVIDFGEEPDGLLYLAMEFLDGQDLFAVLKGGWPLPDERVVDILIQALAALAVAHDQGIVHRDLKPENIMVLSGTDDEGSPRDIVKVCDFGIAKITERRVDQKATDSGRLSTKGLVVGTPEYMSPEQGRGEPLDARSDLYSMGVILYQLLTRQVPFDAESAIGIVLKHVTEDPKPPAEVYPSVNPRLEAICLKALQKKREERYQSARELRADLKAALDGSVATRSIPSAHRMSSGTTEAEGRPAMESAATIPIDMRDAGATTRAATSSPSLSKGTPMATEALDDERPAGVPRRWTGYVLAAVMIGGIGMGGYWVAKKANARSDTSVTVPTAPTDTPHPTTTATVAPQPTVIAPPAPTMSSTPTVVASTSASASHPAPLVVVSSPASPHPPPHPSATVASPAVTGTASVAATSSAAAPTTTAPVTPPPAVGSAQVRVGQPTSVTGDVDAKALRVALASAYLQYNACYGKALHAGAKPQGYTAEMHVKLGSASSAQMAVPDFLSDAGQCVMSAATNALSAVVGNGTAVVPIEFVPGT
ncbi:MAG TPA: protein kinase [Polyangiaceae bacterium]|nr:protein kinase [Polyangiaceae bacterium]